ncbi:hypothetical protein QYE76_000312 [Lolium multiflorum]|uniref:Retrotransposon gag domain-containing protein n=1 Tax=Lolium multiflorum TaxID=4521 RepID=A0AAD8VW91_LOLMU|nr:hypothetical protein QYE76_000312 [Lolium multiflorum]
MLQMLQMMMADREVERAERQANLAALQQLAQNNQGHGNHDHPGSKLKNFQNTNPPMFSKIEEPLDADDWLQTMENNLEVAGVEAAEKVLFATHYLSGPARAWRTSARAMNAGQMMTWEDFKLKFSKYHVPQGLIKKMRDEFCELKQGRMSVVEYRDRFLTLSRYAPDETDTNEKRKERFLNGLHDEMQTVLVNIPFADPCGLSHTDGREAASNQREPQAQDDELEWTPPYTELAKTTPNTTAPAQQQRRFAAGRNQNNHNGRLYHMSATEAQEAPQAMPIMPHHVLEVLHVTLNPLVPALAQGDAHTHQNMTCPGRPGRARARTGTSLDTPEHTRVPLTPSSSRPLFFTHLPSSTSATSRTSPIGRGRAVDDALDDDRRHCTSVHAHDAVDLDHPLLRQDAPKDCLDVANSPMTSPCPFRAHSVVSFLDLAAPPRHSPPSIKGDHPAMDFSHNSSPLISLSLLNLFPPSNSHRSHPICCRSPRRC